MGGLGLKGLGGGLGWKGRRWVGLKVGLGLGGVEGLD